MFREECPEFLNIRLGCWCSNGGRVFSCRMDSGDHFLQPFVMGTSLGLLKQNMCLRMTSTWWSSVVHRTFLLPKLVNPYRNVNGPENPKWALGIGCRLQETYLWRTKFNNKYQNDLHLTSFGWHLYIFKCLYTGVGRKKRSDFEAVLLMNCIREEPQIWMIYRRK